MKLYPAKKIYCRVPVEVIEQRRRIVALISVLIVGASVIVASLAVAQIFWLMKGVR
jgi:hypothetical protein